MNTCIYCEKDYGHNFNGHMKFVHGDQNPNIASFECKKCSGLFVNEQSYKKHIKWHDNRQNYEDEFDEVWITLFLTIA